jgi:hypothetical protein
MYTNQYYTVSLDGLQCIDDDTDSKPVEFLYCEPPHPDPAYCINRRNRKKRHFFFVAYDLPTPVVPTVCRSYLPVVSLQDNQVTRTQRVVAARIAQRRENIAAARVSRIAYARKHQGLSVK